MHGMHRHFLEPADIVREHLAAPAAGQDVGAAPGGGGGGALPFLYGSNRYQEAPFETVSIQLDANSHEYVVNITPGGFLAGVVVQVTSANGVIGTANLKADAPYSVISSLSLDDISGGPVLSPMGGYAHAMKQKWFSPWDGDPSKRADYSASINPAFTLRAMVEVRDTLAVLANTDARAQYRVRFTIAPLSDLVDVPGNVTTAPTVTVNISFITWAQPDAVDLLGNPIEPLPLGLVASRFFQHEEPAVAAANNVIRMDLVGNEIRALGLILRDSTGARVDLTDANTGAMRFRLDQRAEWTRNPSQLVEEMAAFYQQLGDGTWTRETGVYVIPRYRQPGRLIGEYWLQTVEQNLLQLEFNGSDLGANAPGSLEILYDQLAVEGQLPVELEGV